jgi:hypothetical protein
VDSEEILLAAAAATVPCILFDQTLYAIQQWQRKRAGVVGHTGFGVLGRTLISLVINFAICGFVAYLYRILGKEPQDSYLIGAALWLMIAVPFLFTSRYVDESQKTVFTGKILGWLVKTAIAATAAAYLITFAA